MSILRGSGSDSGTAPASGMAGTSEGIALADSVALAEGMGVASAEDRGVVSVEDIAEGIASSRSPSLSALFGLPKSGLRIPKRPLAEFARPKELYEVRR
jgi:hypothetical protein